MSEVTPRVWRAIGSPDRPEPDRVPEMACPGLAKPGERAVSDIRALTGLRGFAAMLVVVYHFCPHNDITADWLRFSIGRGYLWVDLFFVLSGYLMALNYGVLFVNGF